MSGGQTALCAPNPSFTILMLRSRRRMRIEWIFICRIGCLFAVVLAEGFGLVEHLETGEFLLPKWVASDDDKSLLC
jgi:hypothetical protein